jgi:hypothetical protein
MIRPAHRVIRRTVCCLAVTLMSFCGAGKVAAASPQTPTDVCVLMTGSSGQVGGLQLDLHWDPACMTAQQTGSTSVQCASNPATGKNVQTKLFADQATMRAMFFSISDTSPIPDNSELFCCKFTMASSRANSCCTASIGNLILSGPSGGRVYDSSISVQALVGNVPCTDSGPSGSPSNPARPPAPSSLGAPAPSSLGAPAPVIDAPGAAAPSSGGGAAGSRPSAGVGVPAAVGAPAGVGAPAAVGVDTGLEPAPLPTEAVAPTAPATQATPPAATPRTATPQRTLAPTPALTPKPQGTATAASATPPQSSTQTPAPTAKKRHKKQHSQ